MQNTKESESLIAWLPALLFTGRKFESGLALVSDNAGAIVKIVRADELTGEQKMRLSNRAVLPGMVNAHSHAFQRVLRGRTEYRTAPLPFRGGLLPARSDGSQVRLPARGLVTGNERSEVLRAFWRDGLDGRRIRANGGRVNRGDSP